LGHGVHRRGQVRGPLAAHGLRRLDRGYVPVGGLVRAGARADVDHRPRIAQGSMHQGGDAGIGLAVHGIAGTAGLVVEVTSDARRHDDSMVPALRGHRVRVCHSLVSLGHGVLRRRSCEPKSTRTATPSSTPVIVPRPYLSWVTMSLTE